MAAPFDDDDYEDAASHLPDADATLRAGRAPRARVLSGGMIVTLSGELGAGKTTLVRGMLHGLGWTGTGQEPDLHAG